VASSGILLIQIGTYIQHTHDKRRSCRNHCQNLCLKPDILSLLLFFHSHIIQELIPPFERCHLRQVLQCHNEKSAEQKGRNQKQLAGQAEDRTHPLSIQNPIRIVQTVLHHYFILIFDSIGIIICSQFCVCICSFPRRESKQVK